MDKRPHGWQHQLEQRKSPARRSSSAFDPTGTNLDGIDETFVQEIRESRIIANFVVRLESVQIEAILLHHCLKVRIRQCQLLRFLSSDDLWSNFSGANQ